MLEVVAAQIFRADGRMLLCQRSAHKSRPLGWEFPGGKVEPGETNAMALIRECREELNILLAVEGEIADVVCAYPDVEIHLHLLRARVASGTPTALEHNDLRWVLPAEAKDYDLCPADRLLVEKSGVCE